MRRHSPLEVGIVLVDSNMAVGRVTMTVNIVYKEVAQKPSGEEDAVEKVGELNEEGEEVQESQSAFEP